jgi:hypothetical protein
MASGAEKRQRALAFLFLAFLIHLSHWPLEAIGGGHTAPRSGGINTCIARGTPDWSRARVHRLGVAILIVGIDHESLRATAGQWGRKR